MKNLALLLLTCSLLLFTSCSSTTMKGIEKRAQGIELGMSKRECIEVMGTNFSVTGASVVPEGDIEVIEFMSHTSDTSYIFHFLNGNLVEFYRYIAPSENQPGRHNDGRGGGGHHRPR